VIKVSQFLGRDPDGSQLVHLFTPSTNKPERQKLASAYLPEIQKYIDQLRPRDNSIYALINALGSYEYWGPNINADAVWDSHLSHKGPIWGYETYSQGHPFVHHKNKDPGRALGTVELSAWNPRMHRVEIVARIDREKATQFGGARVVQRIDNNELPDVSMGLKVAYDLCSICTDWALWYKSLKTFNPRYHRHPGIAALIYHKTVAPIRGLAITDDDYCRHIKTQKNQILPDGQIVCMFNPYLRLFDISFVFIGAEKTAKMMAKLASRGKIWAAYPRSATVARDWGYRELDRQKVAAVKTSHKKKATILKDVPAAFGKKSITIEKAEPDLPKEVLEELSNHPLNKTLSSSTALGITIKPREFQRITLVRLGKSDLADELEDQNKIFASTPKIDRSISMGPSFLSKLLMSLLRPHMQDRSAFGPILRRRMIAADREDKADLPKEEKTKLLEKVSAAYNGYREESVTKMADLCGVVKFNPELQKAIEGRDKIAEILEPSILLGDIPRAYLQASLERHRERVLR